MSLMAKNLELRISKFEIDYDSKFKIELPTFGRSTDACKDGYQFA